MRRLAIRSILVLAVLGLAACVTPVSEEDVKDQLAEAAGPLYAPGQARVFPIWAETRLVAMALLTEAKRDPESQLSFQLSRRLEVAARRRMRVVVGGPYANLSDQVIRNALAAHEREPLRGLTLVYVSPEPPSGELTRAARESRARLYHRRFEFAQR